MAVKQTSHRLPRSEFWEYSCAPVWRSGRQRVQVVRSSGRTKREQWCEPSGQQSQCRPSEGEPLNEMCHLWKDRFCERSSNTSSLAVLVPSWPQKRRCSLSLSLSGKCMHDSRVTASHSLQPPSSSPVEQVVLPLRRSKHRLSPIDRTTKPTTLLPHYRSFTFDTDTACALQSKRRVTGSH